MCEINYGGYGKERIVLNEGGQGGLGKGRKDIISWTCLRISCLKKM